LKKILQSIIVLSTVLFSDNILSEVQRNGLMIVNQEGKKIKLERSQNALCTKANLTPEALWNGNYAGKRVADICKKTFVTHVGLLQPMDLGKGIKTVGELEILVHIKKSQTDPKDYILIDARTPRWFEQMTIPTSINLPFNEIDYEEDKDEDDFDSEDEYEEYVEAYKKVFKLLNITQTKSGLDFSKAKSVVLFCNGSWCSQSPKAIFKLINMGYPIEKLCWYRGGLQDWLIYDFTVKREEA